MALAAGMLGAVVAPTSAQASDPFVVNSTVDAVDANVGDGVCRAAGGTCTLRAAIQEANAQPGPDVIYIVPGTYAIGSRRSTRTPPTSATSRSSTR